MVPVADGQQLRVSSTFIKPGKGVPMEQVSTLNLSVSEGIKGDHSPQGLSPRHVTIIHQDSLHECDVSAVGARVNIVLQGAYPRNLTSGSALFAGSALIRITFPCEPCAHGAHMASAAMSQFRRLKRYCGTVIHGGEVTTPNSRAHIESHAFTEAPDTFSERSQWAAMHIPPARIVSSLEFLRAIGASLSYSRVLPRWLNNAERLGAPVHRILTASLKEASWHGDARSRLLTEGLHPDDYAGSQFDLTRALWGE